MPAAPRILYCNCTYAQVVPKEVKEAVLRNLCESGVAFDAVADLCEMSARKDPLLKQTASSGHLKIAACYPRAVKWLFAAANAPLTAGQTQVLNMRTQSAEEISATLQDDKTEANVPAGKAVAPSANELPASPALV